MTDGALAVLALAAAVLVWSPPRAVVAARVRSVAGGRTDAPEDPTLPDARRPSGRPPPAWRAWVLPGVAGLATGMLLGGLTGVLAAGLVTVGVARLVRGHRADGNQVAKEVLRHLPVACDLLAVCLGAGLPVGGALAAVAGALPEPLSGRLHAVAGLYRLGASPRRAWAEAPPEIAGLGRVLVRAGESGSAVVPALRALAVDTRAAARGRAEAAVRRAGVWVLAPLGACFLPAFVCLGVVPLVLGIAGDVFP